jgi:hypothetical protein
MGMEAKYSASKIARRSILDDADGRIAVFDGYGELALLEGAAHPLPFALRHVAMEDEAFAASADRADERSD